MALQVDKADLGSGRIQATSVHDTSAGWSPPSRTYIINKLPRPLWAQTNLAVFWMSPSGSITFYSNTTQTAKGVLGPMDYSRRWMVHSLISDVAAKPRKVLDCTNKLCFLVFLRRHFYNRHCAFQTDFHENIRTVHFALLLALHTYAPICSLVSSLL